MPSLRQALERRSGVTDIELNLETGEASMLPGFGMPVDFAAIREGIDDSGFQLLSLAVELSGNLAERRDASGKLRPAIEVKGSGQWFWILAGESPAERKAYAELQQRIDKAGDSVTLLGNAGPDSDAQLSVVLQSIWSETEGG